MKRIFYSLAIICLVIPQLFGSTNEPFTPVIKPNLHVTSTSDKIIVDGEMHETAWKSAAIADNFSEHSPGDQTKPPLNSIAEKLPMTINIFTWH